MVSKSSEWKRTKREEEEERERQWNGRIKEVAKGLVKSGSDQERKERKGRQKSDECEDEKGSFSLTLCFQLANGREEGGQGKGKMTTKRQTNSPRRNPMATLCVSFESYCLSRCAMCHKRQTCPAGLQGPFLLHWTDALDDNIPYFLHFSSRMNSHLLYFLKTSTTATSNSSSPLF